MINKYKRTIIKQSVLLALGNVNKIDFPVDVENLVRSFPQCRLIPYSLHMQKYGLSYQEMLLFAGSTDAFTDYSVSKNRYLIFYNDLDAVTVRSYRYRWNIAHELGHMLLRHHIISSKTRLFRNTLSQQEYKTFESEADYFASYILVPYAALYQLNIKCKEDIARYCKVSTAAASYRFEDYQKWFYNGPFNDEYDYKIYFMYKDIVEKKIAKTLQTCMICHFSSIPYNYLHCPICGSGFLQQKKEGESVMIYTGIDVNSEGKAKICPVCNNEELNYGDRCIICGAMLVNKCTWFETDMSGNISRSCNTILPGNARHCFNCGSQSTFFYYGYLKDWESENADDYEPIFY